MTSDPSSTKRRASMRTQPGGRSAERPTHPKRAAAVLMIAVVLILVLVAALPIFSQ